MQGYRFRELLVQIQRNQIRTLDIHLNKLSMQSPGQPVQRELPVIPPAVISTTTFALNEETKKKIAINQRKIRAQRQHLLQQYARIPPPEPPRSQLEQLLKALEKNTSVNSLDISGYSLNDTHSESLIKFFKHNQHRRFKKIILDHSLTAEQLTRVLKILHSIVIDELSLSGVPVTAASFAYLKTICLNVKKLNLSGTLLTEQQLSLLVSPQIESLILRHNRLKELNLLSTAISTDTKLRELDLAWNDLTDETAALLAQRFCQQPPPKINISYNKMTAEGLYLLYLIAYKHQTHVITDGNRLGAQATQVLRKKVQMQYAALATAVEDTFDPQHWADKFARQKLFVTDEVQLQVITPLLQNFSDTIYSLLRTYHRVQQDLATRLAIAENKTVRQTEIPRYDLMRKL